MIKLNGHVVTPTIFPDKTSQVWQLTTEQICGNNIVEWLFESEQELIHLAQLKTLLNTFANKKVELHIPYLPYARQDKVISNGSTFSLYAFANLLNSLKFDKITTVDVHSTKALELINNLENIEPIKHVYKALMATESNLVCYPDKGALSRYSSIIDEASIYAEKVRDQATGQIVSVKLAGDPKDKTVLICDDLCDGGATFIALSNELYKAGSKKVNLYVTHGLFTKGRDVLKDAGIKRIFTMNGEVQ